MCVYIVLWDFSVIFKFHVSEKKLRENTTQAKSEELNPVVGVPRG